MSQACKVELSWGAEYQVKSKLFIILLEEMICQFCRHICIHSLESILIEVNWPIKTWIRWDLPVLFGWQDHAQKIQGWGCRRGHKVQTDSWWVAQTWSAKKFILPPYYGTEPTSEPNMLKLLMTPAIREWPNRMAAVENVLVIVGFTWHTFSDGTFFSRVGHLRVIAVYETLLCWLHAELL